MVVKTSAIFLLAETKTTNKYLFGAYDNNSNAISFVVLPEDHTMFVETLKNKQTIMGKRTLEATPLDFPDGGRFCISHHIENVRPDAIGVNNIYEAIFQAKQAALNAGQDRVFVIGGAQIISQCLELKLLDEIKLTIVYDYLKEIPIQVFLDFNLEEWIIVEDTGMLKSQHSSPKGLMYRFLTLVPCKE